nr:class I SAM-dependent methyltransferase [uncultured Cohaesibacter sp.]
MTFSIEGKTPLQFWEGLYANASGETSGNPSTALARFAGDRTPGRALDLGCAKGDDAVWLAKQGWQVLGVDIAPAALRHAAANAVRNNVTVRFEQHDLSQSFPDGTFDLISANFLQTPFDLPWADIVRRAAKALSPCGLLLAVTHERVAPWAWSDSEQALPNAKDRFADLALPQSGWHQLYVGPVDRMASGPDGQQAQVRDAVIALERCMKAN